MKAQGLIVHSRPARNGSNDYTLLLAEALEAQGLVVHDVGMTRRDLPFNGNVLLLHWPDEFYKSPPTLKAGIAAWLRLLHLALARRLKGLSIVWVAHNVQPHRDAPRKPPFRWKCFLRLLDGVIALSQSSANHVLNAHPALAGTPLLVTAHGHYMARAERPPSLPLPIEGRAPRLAALGSIRENKRLDKLADLVANAATDATLDIRGSAAHQDKPLARRLEAMASTHPRLSVDVKFLSNAEFERATDAADLIVLPYGDILNSGVLLYALSRYRPVIAPPMGSIPEIRNQVGEEWIYLMDGNLNEAGLLAALDWLKTTPRPSPPDLSSQDWDGIGTEVAAFLKKVARQ